MATEKKGTNGSRTSTSGKSTAGRSSSTRPATRSAGTSGRNTGSKSSGGTGSSKSSSTTRSRETGSGTVRKSNTLRPRPTYQDEPATNSRGRYNGENYGRVNETMTDEIIIIVVLLLCILMVLSYFGICGIVGTGVNAVVFGMFGKLGYALPFIILMFTLFFAANDGRFVSTSKVICSVVFLVIISALVQLFGYGYDPELGLGEYFKNSCLTYEGENVTGGGFFGGLLVKILCPLFGQVGAVIIMLAVALIMIVLITGKAFITYFSKKVRETSRIRREERRLARAERRIYDDIEGYGDEYDEYDDDDDNLPRVRHRMGSIAVASGKQPGKVPADSNPEQDIPMDEQVQIPDIPENPVQSPVNAGRKNNNKLFAGKQENKQAKKNEPVLNVDSTERKATVPMQTATSTIVEETKDKFSDKSVEIPRTSGVNFDHAKSLRAGSSDSETPKINISFDTESGEYEYGPKDFEEAENTPPSKIVLIRKLEESLETDFKVNISGIEDDFGIEEKLEKIDDSEASANDVDGNRKFSGIHVVENRFDEIAKEEEKDIPEEAIAKITEIVPVQRTEQSVYDENVPEENIQNTIVDGNNDENGNNVAAPISVVKPVTSKTVSGSGSNSSSGANSTPVSSGNDSGVYRDSSGAVRFTDMSAESMEKAEPPQPEYIFPPIEFLRKGKVATGNAADKRRELEETIDKLQRTFESFGVGVKVTDASVGPTVTRYELLPDQGVKVKTITSLSDDIKLALAAAEIRIEAPIPGKAAVGIEVPNKENVPVFFGDLIDSEEFRNSKSKLSIAIGKDISGKSIVSDIAGMPHALIAGATGSGKSVCINALIMSILYKAKPSEVKMIMIDPKRVELVGYNGIPHLLVPVVTDVKKATGALNWAIAEMDDRYKRFADCAVTNLASYNQLMEQQYFEEGNEGECPDKLPQIVIIVDELNDLMMTANSKEVEGAICRLTQLARACGIHVVLATQRPSVNVITGTIKANIPTRMAFAVSSLVDSRTIIDQAGAEKLLGKGDMLFYPQGYPKPVRLQGAFVSDGEVKKVVDHIKATCRAVKYNDAVSKHIDTNSEPKSSAVTEEKADRSSGRDELFEEAGKFIIEKEKASIGMLQRVYKIGFNRAARIMDQLCDAGVVGPEEGTKPRKILMNVSEFEEFINLPEE